MGIGLETLFHLVYEIVHWIVQWMFPHMSRIEVTDRGVKISGKTVTVLEPGSHWWHRRLSTVYTANVKRQTHALEDQLLTTGDDKRVRVGGVLVYTITDIEKWLIENEDSADAVGEMAAHALREVVIETTFDEMQKARQRKRDELTRSAQEMLGMFGVRVEYLRLTSFAETDAKDLHHSGSLEVGRVAETSDEEDY